MDWHCCVSHIQKSNVYFLVVVHKGFPLQLSYFHKIRTFDEDMLARMVLLQNWLKPTTILEFGGNSKCYWFCWSLTFYTKCKWAQAMPTAQGSVHAILTCLSSALPLNPFAGGNVFRSNHHSSVHPCCVRLWLSHHHHYHHHNHCKKTSDTFPGRCEFKVLLTQKPARVEPALPKGWHPVGTMSTANQVKTMYVQVLFPLKRLQKDRKNGTWQTRLLSFSKLPYCRALFLRHIFWPFWVDHQVRSTVR